MAITTRQKTVFATSDGKEHATRLEATRYETRLTLAQLGFKMETATHITGMGVDTLRAVARELNDYADAKAEIDRERQATRTREEVNDLGEDSVGTWPADANVAPRRASDVLARRGLRTSDDLNEDEGI